MPATRVASDTWPENTGLKIVADGQAKLLDH